MIRRFGMIALALVTVALVAQSTALAATTVRLDMSGLVGQSEAIAIAQVTEIESELAADGRVYTTISFSTHEVLKGRIDESFQLRHLGGRADGVTTRVPGMPQFQSKERVFLFLRHVDDAPVITGLSQGKFQIAVGPDGTTDYVIPDAVDQHLVDPERIQQRRDVDKADDGVERRLQADTVDAKDHTDLFGRIHNFDDFVDRVESEIERQRPVQREAE